MARNLPEETSKSRGPDLSHRIGTVIGPSAGVWKVTVGGTVLAGVGWLSSYAPAVGDEVYVVRRNTGWLVLGKILFRG